MDCSLRSCFHEGIYRPPPWKMALLMMCWMERNNSSPFWRALLKQSGRVSPGRSLSSSPSPISLLERCFTGELGIPSAKRIAAELLPKTGRPRSKSTADKPKKKTSARSRSRSQDQATKNMAVENNSLNTFSPMHNRPQL